MKKAAVIIGVMAAVGLGTAAYAEDIVYVDLMKMFNEYRKTADYDKQLEQKQTAKESELQKKKEEIDQMREGLELLKDEARVKREEELSVKANELQTEYRDALTALKEERDQKMQEILEDIEKAVSDYAKKNGHAVIMKKAAVAYADESLERTQEVLNTLNAGQK